MGEESKTGKEMKRKQGYFYMQQAPAAHTLSPKSKLLTGVVSIK